jgi:hypothetical protein
MHNPLMVKSPDLKFRYSIGMGDIVACFLHSKPINWLTYFITKKDKPCTICSQRRHALNILLPIPFWKLFFENRLELLEELAAEYRSQGYKAKINKETETISVSKFMTVED